MIALETKPTAEGRGTSGDNSWGGLRRSSEQDGKAEAGERVTLVRWTPSPHRAAQ